MENRAENRAENGPHRVPPVQLGPPGRAAILPSGAGAAFPRAAAPRKWGETPGLCKLGAQLGAAVVISAAHRDSGHGCSFRGRIGHFPPNSWDRWWIQLPDPSSLGATAPSKALSCTQGTIPTRQRPFPCGSPSHSRSPSHPCPAPSRQSRFSAPPLQTWKAKGRKSHGHASQMFEGKGLGAWSGEEQGES